MNSYITFKIGNDETIGYSLKISQAGIHDGASLINLGQCRDSAKIRLLRINVLGLKINAGNSNCGSPMICHYFPSGQKRFTAVQGGKRYFMLRIKHILGSVSILCCRDITDPWTALDLFQKLDS